MKLEIVDVNEGHCQVTYRTKNANNENIYYCLQEESRDRIRMMRCSQDGEPSHPATPKSDSIIEIEIVPGNSRLAIVCNKYIGSNSNLHGFQ